MFSTVSALGAEHHGDINELILTREHGDTDELTVEVSVGTTDQVVTVIPEQSHTKRLVISGHLLPPGESTLTVTTKPRDGQAHTIDLALNVPPTSSPLHDEVRRSLKNSSHSLLSSTFLDSSEFAYNDDSLTPWFDRPDASTVIASRLANGGIDRERATQLSSFVSDGFVILEDAVPDRLLRELRGAIDNIVDTSYGGYTWGSSDRIHHAHFHYPSVAELTQLPAVTNLLRDIFGAEPRVCQTLTYIFGSQQGSHQDTVHLTPFPAGYMCGVWVALEDVRPGSGELRYYPGSHRLDRVYMNSVGCEKVTDGNWAQFGSTVVPRWESMLIEGGYEIESFLPKAGTVLIWHENLMHQGAPRTDMNLSRKSIVTHYFASGPIAYYDSSGDPARFHFGAMGPNH